MLSKSLALVLSGVSLVQALHQHPHSHPHPGFKLTWREDFNGKANSPPDPVNWMIDTGTSYPGGPPSWGTGEIQTYTDRPQNVRLNGHGLLQITPLRSANNTWTSARIETQRTDFQARAGGKMRIAGRIRMPDNSGEAAAGYWPAFWTLGENYRGNYQNWPSVGEYDIMENVNSVNRAWGVLHCGINPGGPCNEAGGLGENTECPGAPCQGNWHVYMVEVDRSVSPETLTWSVDGVPFHNVTEHDVGNATWAQTVHHGHFLLLNLAIGGSFPNGVRGSATPINATVPGVPLYVDWVAVYNSV